jgi:hypothetical protein
VRSHPIREIFLVTKKPKVEIAQKSVAELIASLDPENPRSHDADIPGLAMRLLRNGWQKLPTYNKQLKKLVGGHGRVYACQWLIQQPKEWFEMHWGEWLEQNSGRYSQEAILGAKERFAPKYWLQIPVTLAELSDRNHKIMLVALNQTAAENDIESKVAGLLSKIQGLDAEDAGFTEEQSASLLNKYGLMQKRMAEEEMAIAAQEAIDIDASAIAEVMSEIEEQAEYEEEADITEGGANHNADPAPGEKRVVTYPLAVILGPRQLEKYEALKEKLGVANDVAILKKYHPAFAG